MNLIVKRYFNILKFLIRYYTKNFKQGYAYQLFFCEQGKCIPICAIHSEIFLLNVVGNFVYCECVLYSVRSSDNTKLYT